MNKEKLGIKQCRILFWDMNMFFQCFLMNWQSLKIVDTSNKWALVLFTADSWRTGVHNQNVWQFLQSRIQDFNLTLYNMIHIRLVFYIPWVKFVPKIFHIYSGNIERDSVVNIWLELVIVIPSFFVKILLILRASWHSQRFCTFLVLYPRTAPYDMNLPLLSW